MMRPKSRAPEAHQIGRDSQRIHSGRGHDERQRNHQSRDDRGAGIAEKKEQRGGHEQRADRKVLRHGGDRGIDELRAIKQHVGDDARAADCSEFPEISAWTEVATVRLFSPVSINAVPITTSCPFLLAAPVRNCPPIRTVATRLIVTGTLSRVATTARPISSMEWMRASARTR